MSHFLESEAIKGSEMEIGSPGGLLEASPPQREETGGKAGAKAEKQDWASRAWGPGSGALSSTNIQKAPGEELPMSSPLPQCACSSVDVLHQKFQSIIHPNLLRR